MAWSVSKIFTAHVTDALNKAKGYNLGSDTIEVALFDNTITPSQTVASASTAYAAGVWAGGGQSSGTSWPALGRPLANQASSFATNVFTFSNGGVNLASADAACTLTGAYGCLVYDHTTTSPAGVTDAGICFLYFGGSQAITSGTFAIAFNASGIYTLTL